MHIPVAENNETGINPLHRKTLPVIYKPFVDDIILVSGGDGLLHAPAFLIC